MNSILCAAINYAAAQIGLCALLVGALARSVRLARRFPPHHECVQKLRTHYTIVCVLRGRRRRRYALIVIFCLLAGSCRSRAEVIDFTAPYFHSGVSLLAAPKTKSEIPLLAFLLPFSPELWIAIFTSLNITAVAVAVYEWLSPFGLNPWGRQRSKNFSMSSGE